MLGITGGIKYGGESIPDQSATNGALHSGFDSSPWNAQPHARLIGWLLTYQIATPGVELGDNPTVRLDLDNEAQPDAVLLIDPQLGGQARLSEDDYRSFITVERVK